MRLNLKDTILIALLPFYGYIAAYAYEVGYLSSFNLPSLLAQVRIESLVIFTTSVILTLFALFALVNAVLPIYKAQETYPILKIFIRDTYILGIIIFITIYFYPPGIKYIPVFIGISVLNLLFSFGLPQFVYRKEKNLTFTDKLRKDQSVKAEIKKSKENSKIPSLMSNEIVFNVISLALIAVKITNNKLTTEFLLLDNTSELNLEQKIINH